MLRINIKTIMLLASVLVVLGAYACGSSDPLPDIEPTVEVRLEVAKASLVVPTSIPLLTSTPTQAPPTPSQTPVPTSTSTQAPPTPTQIPVPTSTPTQAPPTPTQTQIPTVTLTPTSRPTAIPTATPTPRPTAIPTATPASRPTAIPIATPTATPPSQKQHSDNLNFAIVISEIPGDLPKYDRGKWNHWVDHDKDCQNTRHEVLIEESQKDVLFKDGKKCQVATGEWLDPYTGLVVTDATKLDVDHMVPLKNAHDSGGWQWDKSRKADYANYMQYADHLIAVTASANRQKSANGPEAWKPSNKDYWCEYVVNWLEIKIEWELSVTNAELAAIEEMIGTCDNPPSITTTHFEIESNPTATATSETTNVQLPSSNNIQIASIDCKSKPEIVVVENIGNSIEDLSGWKIEDEGPKHIFTFPEGFSLRSESSVQLISGEPGEDSDETIYWSNRVVWNNTGDTASLFNLERELVSDKKCP